MFFFIILFYLSILLFQARYANNVRTSLVKDQSFLFLFNIQVWKWCSNQDCTNKKLQLQICFQATHNLRLGGSVSCHSSLDRKITQRPTSGTMSSILQIIKARITTIHAAFAHRFTYSRPWISQHLRTCLLCVVSKWSHLQYWHWITIVEKATPRSPVLGSTLGWFDFKWTKTSTIHQPFQIPHRSCETSSVTWHPNHRIRNDCLTCIYVGS